MAGTEFYNESRSSKTSFLTGMWVGFFLCYPYFMYKHFVGSPWDGGGGVIWRGRWGYNLAPTYFNILRRIGEKCAINLKSVGVGGYLLGSDKNSVSGIFLFLFLTLDRNRFDQESKTKKKLSKVDKIYFRENTRVENWYTKVLSCIPFVKDFCLRFCCYMNITTRKTHANVPTASPVIMDPD